MPMTAAERQRKYIEKLRRENPEKYEEKRKKHLQKVKDRQIKKVKSLTDEEKQKRKENNNATKTKQPKQQDKEQEELLKNNIELRRKNSVLEKKVSLLNKQIKSLKKTINRYKFKVDNLQSKIEAYDDLRLLMNDEQVQNKDSELQLVNAATPLTRASLFVDETLPSTSDENQEKIKKKLFELNLQTDSLKTVYSNADSNKTKAVLKKVVKNEITSRYKMKNTISAKLGIDRIRKRQPISNRMRIKTIHTEEIKSFFCRDDVSRATAGKQETKTQHKNKKQKRYLIDSMLNLHMKYRQEGGKLSYATFVRLKPFYVQRPNINDRNTSACTKH